MLIFSQFVFLKCLELFFLVIGKRKYSREENDLTIEEEHEWNHIFDSLLHHVSKESRVIPLSERCHNASVNARENHNCQDLISPENPVIPSISLLLFYYNTTHGQEIDN